MTKPIDKIKEMLAQADRIKSLEAEAADRESFLKTLADTCTEAERIAIERAGRIDVLESECRKLRARLEKAGKDAASKQARIDELMLEYCPDEMTPEQIDEWAKHQEPVIAAIAKERTC